MAQLPDYVVLVEGLEDLNLADESAINRAASTAINDTAKFARSDAADTMRRQYNFPGNYLDPSTGRLVIGKRSTPMTLEASVTGRKRATSLARFIVQSNGLSKQGAVIEMLNGQQRTLERAFPVALRSGKDGPGSNIGLAVRTKDGKKPQNAYKPIELYSRRKDGSKRGGAWLLYGISVNQAFRLAKEMTADRARLFLQTQTQRLLEELDL